MTVPRLRIAAFTAALAVAGAALAGGSYSATFDKTYPMNKAGRVSLENVNGEVEVTVWDRAEVQVHAVKEASSQSRLDAVEINVKASDDRVAIETHYPSSFGHLFNSGHAEVSYSLTIPRTARLEIDLVNGPLKAEGVSGGLEVEAVNGTVTLRNVAGDIRVETVNGTQQIALAALDPSASVSLESVNGHIELTLPSGAGADVHAETVNGRISNDLGLEVEKHRWVGAELSGRLGGGGARVEISTVNGGMTIR